MKFKLAFIFVWSIALSGRAEIKTEQSSGWETLSVVLLGYHSVALPHEFVHIGVNAATGGEFERFNIYPWAQSVDLKKADRDRSAPRWKSVATSMSAPMFSRATTDLPYWIHKPTSNNYYSKFVAAYDFWSRGILLSTLAFAYYGQLAKTDEGFGDFDLAARAISDRKSEQQAFLGGLSLLIGLDFYLNWNEFQTAADVMLGREKYFF